MTGEKQVPVERIEEIVTAAMAAAIEAWKRNDPVALDAAVDLAVARLSATLNRSARHEG